jgi:hypothetical protein
VVPLEVGVTEKMGNRMRRGTARAQWAWPAVLAVATAACAPGVGTSGPGLGQTEGRVSGDAFGNTSIALGGRTFALKPIDGRQVGNLAIQVAGKFYTTNNGAFGLAESALRDAQSNSRGFFRVFAPGYVPKQVWIGQQGNDVPLIPVLASKISIAMSSTGGAIASPEQGLAITLGAGFLAANGTNVAVSTYTPELTTDLGPALATRKEFLNKFAKLRATPKGAYTLKATSDCAGSEQPLPCQPEGEGLGIMLTVDGPANTGTMTSRLDLAAMANSNIPARVAAAKRILQTFAQIDSNADNRLYRELLANEYGLSLVGQTLTFSVQLGANAASDGFARVEVAGMDLLGVKLEVTAVSSLAGTLPAAASLPALVDERAREVAVSGAASAAEAARISGAAISALAARKLATDGVASIGQDSANLQGGLPALVGVDAASYLDPSQVAGGGLFSSIIAQGGGNIIAQGGGNIIAQGGGNIIAQGGGNIIAQGGGNIIAQGGGNVIAQGGGNIIAQGGGNLITNDGGSLVGHLDVPFRPEPMKFGLLAFTSWPYAGEARVRAILLDGTPISRWVSVDSHSNYFLVGLPKTPAYFFIIGDALGHRLRAMAMAPGNSQVTAHINATTTAVTSQLLAKITNDSGDADTVNKSGYNSDMATLAPLLDQATAQAIVDPHQPIAQTGATIDALETARSLVASVILPMPPFKQNKVRYNQANEDNSGQNPQAPVLLSATLSNFAVLAGTTVTNTGPTALTGDLGLSPGSSVVGFDGAGGPGMLTGSKEVANSAAALAKVDLALAFTNASARVGAPITEAGNIGGLTLAPGLYKSTSSLAISSGDLTLDAQGDANAVWVFQMGSTLTTTPGRKVILAGGAKANNVFWVVGSSATIGTTSVFKGNILAAVSITINTGATLEGRALTQSGAVTLDTNTITLPAP